MVREWDDEFEGPESFSIKMKNVYIYVQHSDSYIYMNHCAVHLKLTQHYKSTILQ